MLSNKKFLYSGIGGTVIAALCCFTPLLVVLFAVVGVSAWLGWIDYVLFPALGFFALLTLYELYRQKRYPEATSAVTESTESEART